MKSALYVEIGKRIRATRERQNISQKALGDTVGLTRPSIANIESGLQHPTAEKLYEIAQALDVTIADLLPDKIPDDAKLATDKTRFEF